MKSKKKIYRVECNFGSKYFDNLDKALKYFQKKVGNHLYVELWKITRVDNELCAKGSFIVMQKLMICSVPVLQEI